MEEQRLAWFVHGSAYIWTQTQDLFFLCDSHIQGWPLKANSEVHFPSLLSSDLKNSGQVNLTLGNPVLL